jgi:hypothetical protein
MASIAPVHYVHKIARVVAVALELDTRSVVLDLCPSIVRLFLAHGDILMASAPYACE